ncbi:MULTISPECIES: glutamate--cysteine ligase [unclassified Devosia]|uniref:glutamate--cysteine ligase n=1 Tax=unclassified Devosia TaxID=196773 RepID=UPI00145FB306|nr:MULTISPECIES: glutamate--cysteine ligase [unclassified Devosia]MBJ6988300.1 glutamate--cysteine ligase [Devosia sp. MC521]MBJ7577534.1 glutamate--cysteine ligase [Devosia sp. MC532]MBK1794557.1 glutamate--cysteine ligase [Devosia sp. WQ 349K1]QMW63192.1 glutamate--cysteine ligase [Devosia sp. MC521]
MAGAKTTPLIESRNDLIEAMSRGCKPADQWRIGTEHEKHVFYTNPLDSVPYAGDRGIKALLEGVAKETGWTPFYDGENAIGLSNTAGAGGVSLEPGGQFELSGAPLETIHQTADELAQHMAISKKVAGELGIHFLGLGVTPLWSVEQIKAMPKSRYGIMTDYMGRTGTLGTSMMYRSATVQTNLDFSSEADMVKKLRVSVALQPIATALFANSPFVDGKDSGFLSFRSHIWLNTDNDRTGMLPFAFEEGFGFEQYADYALDVPMYFVIRDGKYINVAGESFRAFLDGALPQLPGEKPTIGDWEDHLSTIFPEVRMKQFLEMRGADMGDERHVVALSAFWTGLLYDETSLEAAWELVKNWTHEEREYLRSEVPRLGLNTPFDRSTLFDIAAQAVGIASAGLARRNRLNAKGEDESIHIAPLEETVRSGKSPAEVWLDRFHNEWNGDITPIFKAAEL